MNLPNGPSPVSRRRILTSGAAIAATAAAAGCDLLGTEPSTGGDSDREADKSQREAPQFADMVKAGDLPPLEDRLPESPLVLEPIDEIGTYGGTWRTFIQGVEGAAVYENIGYDGLVSWTPDFTEIEPNVVDWEASDDGREYTLNLRKGMKWSDGKPFTTDDIAFAYNDIISNTDLYPVFPTWMMAGGEPATFEQDDEYTCRFVFAEPHAFFMIWMARPEGAIFAGTPKHYLQDFHKEHASDIDKLVEDAGFAEWPELFWNKGGGGVLGLEAWQNPDLPTLLPWILTTPLTGNRLIAERNPYYWKTDPDGRQLPYIDKVIIEVIESPETAVLRTSQGEFTLPSTDVLTPVNKPLFAQGTEQGNYRIVDQLTSDINGGVFCLNLTHKDPVLREVFNNKDFRIGLSYAINREELIGAVHQRQGEPYQSAPRPESDFFHEQLAKQYTEHDPDKANEHLDAAGYTEKNSDGIRLRPDGKPISITVELPTGYDPTYPSTCELVKQNWKDVGIDLVIKAQGGPLYWERLFANEHDAVIYSAENGLRDAILDPGWFFPVGGRCYYARGWADWYNTRGEEGEEPPEQPRRQMELYDQIAATTDEAEQQELFAEILQISADEFYAIGTVLIAGRYSIVLNSFRNVLEPIPEGSLYPDPAPIGPEQFFIVEEE